MARKQFSQTDYYGKIKIQPKNNLKYANNFRISPEPAGTASLQGAIIVCEEQTAHVTAYALSAHLTHPDESRGSRIAI